MESKESNGDALVVTSNLLSNNGNGNATNTAPTANAVFVTHPVSTATALNAVPVVSSTQETAPILKNGTLTTQLSTPTANPTLATQLSTPAPEQSASKVEEAGSDTEDEGDSEILEESPCGRWQKRDERVPGLEFNESDVSYLAMDSEEGVEVVWNETFFNSKKKLNEQRDKIHKVYDHLIALEHANIGRFHDYWIDTTKEKPRVVFITEYMSSGSLKQFLRKTKSNKTWKRCCSQILSALSYLQNCNPPIIHGNLNCDNIFIQHDGLVKIGPVAPDAIQLHMPGKHGLVVSMSSRNEKKNLHYLAPEYGKAQPLTTASDIYSFGICALVMARPELLQGGEENKLGSISNLQATIAKIQNPLLVDLIQHCVYEDPANRNDAITLLFHPVFFEGHSLKLYAAHTVVGLDLADVFSQQPLVKGIKGPYSAEKLSEKQSYKINGKVTWKLDIEQYLEDVKIGAHPLSFYDKAHKKQTENKNQPVSAARSQTPEDHFALKITGSDDLLNGAKAVHYGSSAVEATSFEVEVRTVQQMSCSILPKEEGETSWNLTLLLRLADKMNRQLTCDIDIDEDTAECLTDELIYYGFISKTDRDKVMQFLDQSFQRLYMHQQTENSNEVSEQSLPISSPQPPPPPPPQPDGPNENQHQPPTSIDNEKHVQLNSLPVVLDIDTK